MTTRNRLLFAFCFLLFLAVRFSDDFLILTKTEKKAEDAIEITDMLLDDMQIDLNPLKTKIVSFDHGFKFLGAIFVRDSIFLPFLQRRVKGEPPRLPEPLTLRRYLELKNRLDGWTVRPLYR